MATDILITTPKSYPWPEGMMIPNLMPYQAFAFNGDPFLASEVLRLKEAHDLVGALETGTCLGSTTLWLAENFDKVWTCEVSDQFYEIACARFAAINGSHAVVDNTDRYYKTIIARKRDSRIAVKQDAARVDFIFLDAHWGPHCPLLDELNVIADVSAIPRIVTRDKPCILIHDFQVPGTDFGYDCMPDGRPFNLELIRGHLDRIYGEGKWKHRYPTEVAGARRGWISISPL